MPGQPCLLAGCVLELKQAMEPYMAFSDNAILEAAVPQETSLEGQTGAAIPRKIQPAPPEVPTEVAPIEELAPPEVPTKEAAPIKEPTEEVPPQRSPLKRWPPQWSPLKSQQQ